MRSKTPYVKLLHLLLIVFSITVSSSLNGQILFQSSFEGTNPFNGWSNSQSCCSHSVTASTTVVHDGAQSFRSEVRPNDPSVSSGYRAELVLPNISDQGNMWYGFSMYFQGNTSNNTDWGGVYGHVLQWHPNNGSGSAELAIYADGGDFDITTNPTGGAGGTHQSQGLQDIQANRWYDIVLNVVWGNGGSVTVWIDGQLYFTRNNLNWAPGAYLKLGMNRWVMSNTWVVFYDNVKIGRNVTYNDVAPTATAPGNQAPVANAGNNITMTLPTNSATLTGSGTDADGTIASYAWTRTGGTGTTHTIANPNSATTGISNLSAGTHIFRLTVTDDDGSTGFDDVTVTVNSPPNTPPTANAGSDITMTLPTNSATLNGTGTDANGTIASYQWTRTGGTGTTYTIANPNSASTGITNLSVGTHTFRLTVTDNGGATATDNVLVTVLPQPNQAPSANAGSDITMTLPTNSANLTGSGTDADGTIASYLWARTGGTGTTFTIANVNAASTGISNLSVGTHIFRLTVTDDDGATATDNITVTVNAAPNTPPVANAGNNITITLPTNTTTLNGSGTDANGTITGYAWTRTGGTGTTFTIANPNSASTGLSNLSVGTHIFRLTVTDNNGATDTDDVTVTVNAAANVPPVAEAGNNITITLPTNTTTLNGSGTDANGTITGYAWTRIGGTGTTFTIGNPNSASTGLSNLSQGTHIFRLTVTDNNGATDTDDVTVTVNASAPANIAPIANAGNNVSLNLPANSTPVSGSASTDPDGTIAGYAWSFVSGPTASYNIANANAMNTTISGLGAGTWVFRLTVTDNDGDTDSDNITITVSATPNQPPSANAGNNIIITLPVNSTNLNGGNSTDADGTISTYTWTRVGGTGTTFNIVNATASATGVNSLSVGTHIFRLTVRDNDGATATDDVTVTVNPAVNLAPTANAGSDITMTLPVNSAILTGSGYDPDGSIATYAWTRVGTGGPFTLVNAASASTGVNGLTAGTYTFRLTVTDNNGATASDIVTVTVNPAVNVAPTVNAGADITITLPINTTTLNGSATDPNGSISSFAWTRIDGTGTTYTIASPGSASTGLSNLAAGTYVFRLTVTDNNGATASDNVTVTVIPAAPTANQAPNARAGNNIILTLPVNGTSLNGNTSFDVDGVITAYQWTQVSGPSQITIGSNASAIANVNGLTIGNYVFQLRVTDDDGATATATVTVEVRTQAGGGSYFNVYPNPTSGILNIQFYDNNIGKVKVSVFDANRRLMMDKEMDKNQAGLNTTIDATMYGRGVYFLQIILPDNQKVVKQFVKM